MSQRRAPKRNLSKGILEMKFMKKSKEKVEKEKEYEESREFFGKNLSRQVKDGNEFVIEPSMVPIDDLLSGRMSFKGMNPVIERLMELEQLEAQEREKNNERLRSNIPEITDEEMAHHLGATIRNKFNTKNTKSKSRDNDSDEDSDNASLSHDEEGSADSSKRDSECTPPKKLKFLKPTDND